jgi:hypothetical protein
LATVTFLNERADITGPDTAVAGVRQTTERRCSVRHQPVDNDQSDHAHQGDPGGAPVNSADSVLGTITFLGEQQDIIGPEAAVFVAGQMT